MIVTGDIQLPRSIVGDGLWSLGPVAAFVGMTCVMLADQTGKTRATFLTTRRHLCGVLGMSESPTRRALEQLREIKFLKMTRHRDASLIKILDFDRFAPRAKTIPGEVVREAAIEVIDTFNACFRRRLRPATWEPVIYAALKARFTVEEMRAALWYGEQSWSEDLWKHLDPKTFLRISSREKTTLAQYVDKAGELWRERHPNKPPPWETNT